MSSKFPAGISKGPKGDWKIRATAKSRRTGGIEARKATLPSSASLKDAVLKHDELVEMIRSGGRPAQAGWTVQRYAEDWLPRQNARLGSDTTRARYSEHLVNHILPHFGPWQVSQVDKMAIEAWLVQPRNKYELHNLLPGRVQRESEPYSPATVNGWWRVLKEMLRDAVEDLHLDRDPTLRVEPLPDRVDPDELGDETVNSLDSAEVVALLAVAKKEYPQWFAFVFLGFITGCRPGELRPIRWGKDLEETTGKLTIRRSQRNRHLGPTKTKKARTLALPPEVMTVLQEHRAWLKRNGHPLADGELVFPPAGRHWRAHRKSRWASVPEAAENDFHTASSLDKPLDRMAMLAGIKRAISPKVFRRSFNDIARKEAQLNNVLIRAQTGHGSIEMQETYSTIDMAEKRAGMAKVIDLFQTKAQDKGQVEGQVGGLFGAIPDHLRKRQTSAKR